MTRLTLKLHKESRFNEVRVSGTDIQLPASKFAVTADVDKENAILIIEIPMTFVDVEEFKRDFSEGKNGLPKIKPRYISPEDKDA